MTRRTLDSMPPAPLFRDIFHLKRTVVAPIVGRSYAQLLSGGFVAYTLSGWLGDLGRIDTYANAAALTGIADGTTATCARIAGVGSMRLNWEGGRCAVASKEIVATLTPAEMKATYTAVGTAWVSLKDFLVGPLIGDGEVWTATMKLRLLNSPGGNVVGTMRATSSTQTMGQSLTSSANGQRGRTECEFQRLDGNLNRMSGVIRTYTPATRYDLAVADWSSLSIQAGVTPFTVGNQIVMEEFAVGRES